MNKIVDRDTFLYYLDNADVNWEATARECIAKGFELADENKKLKEKLEKIEKVILRCKEANCTNCEYQDKCNFNGDDFDDYILRIVRGEEDER